MANANNSNKTEKDPSLLLACYGAKSFVKVYQALEIDKIKFSFVLKGNEGNPIDIYMNAEDFEADLMAEIRGKQLERKRLTELERARSANEKYCKDIWESRVGKSTKNTIRKFTIQPGMNTEYVFRASESAENGKSNAKNITVGISGKDLALLVFRWGFLFEDYKNVLRKRYSMAEMRSNYHPKEDPSDIPDDYVEEQPPMDPAEIPEHNAMNTQKTRRKPFSAGSDDMPTCTNDSEKAISQSNNVCSYRMKVKTPIVLLSSGNYAFEGYTQDNRKYAVVINPISFSPDSLNAFCNICAKVGTMINFRGICKENRILATGIN